MISERKYKIYKKWFKLGFEHQKQNGFNPNSYRDIDTSYRLKYRTFKERLPWNVYWTYLGYLDGYNVANPFDCHETIYNIDIRKIWNARLEHKKITKAEYYIYIDHTKKFQMNLLNCLIKSTALMVGYITKMSRGGRSYYE